jgi:3-phenylpropionate/cinnamic acid dioxygenase small subunit
VTRDVSPQKLADLVDKLEITELLYRVARATDRGDTELYADCFHEDGTDFHGLANGSVRNILSVLGSSTLLFTQHCVSNVLVALDGDVARVESCFVSFHQGREQDGTLRDESIRGRYLDVVERRGGPWKIAQRLVVWDWSRVEPAAESWFDRVRQRPDVDDRFVFGRRDRSDFVYTWQLPADLVGPT